MNTPGSASDNQIISKILSRDRRTLLVFYRRYAPKLSRFIAGKIANPGDAEEVLQDTLYAFLEAIRDFQGKSNIQTFLFSICQHKVVDYYRKKKLKQNPNQELSHRQKILTGILLRVRNYETHQSIRSMNPSMTKLCQQLQ